MTLQDSTHRGTAKRARKLVAASSDKPGRKAVLSELIAPDQLMSLVESMLDEGWALSIGRTRDGGAIAWGFLQGGAPVKRYTANVGEVEALLDEAMGE